MRTRLLAHHARLSWLGATVAMWTWPAVALACPVCFDPREENRLAFLITTVFLTLLPLALMGGTVYWLWRKYKRDSAALMAGEGTSGA